MKTKIQRHCSSLSVSKENHYHSDLIRYRIGLVMFCLPLLFGWLEPYISSILPGYESYQLVYNISGDVLFISSFFVLAGDFWDRLQVLFVHRDSITGPNEGLQHVSAKQYL